MGLEQAPQAPPSMRHSKVEPPSLELKENEALDEFVGSAGCDVIEVFGEVLSTVTETRPEVNELPARSDVTARRSYWPSATAVVSNATEYGARVSESIVVQLPSPRGERWNTTVPTPEPPASAEFAATAIEARTLAPSAGAVIEPVGFVLSTRTVIAAEVKELPALSVVTTRRS